MIRVIPKECTGLCLLGSAVSVAWAGWVTFILQGNEGDLGDWMFRGLIINNNNVYFLYCAV